jgi:hypothetical protein
MKRIFLYLVLVPIIAPLATGVSQAIISGGNPFSIALQRPSYFLGSAYFNWLLPALTIAIADRLVQPDKRLRLGIIAAVGCVSTFVADVALYGFAPRSWQPGLIGAIAALVCCLLLDQLNRERLTVFGAAILSTINVLRRYPQFPAE